MTANAGCTFYGFSAYISALTARGRFSLTEATLGPTVSFAAAGLTAPLVARLLDHVDVRALMASGAVVTGSMIALLGHVETSWELWAVFAVCGIGSSGFAMIPASTLVVRWFGASPSRPMAIMATGYGAGGTIIPPALATLIGRAGLAEAGVWVGVALIAVVVLLTVLFVRNPPYAASASPQHVERRARIFPRGSRLPFACLGLAFLFFFTSQVGLVTHMLTIGRDLHLDAAPALSALAVANLGFRLLGIPLVARIGVRASSVAFAAAQVVALLLLADAQSMPLLILGAALFGTTVGNLTVALPLNAHRAFGVARFAAAYSRLTLVTTVGTTAAPVLLGALRTLFGGYAVPLVLLAAGSAAGAVLLLLLPRPAEAEVAGAATPTPTATS